MMAGNDRAPTRSVPSNLNHQRDPVTAERVAQALDAVMIGGDRILDQDRSAASPMPAFAKRDKPRCVIDHGSGVPPTRLLHQVVADRDRAGVRVGVRSGAEAHDRTDPNAVGDIPRRADPYNNAVEATNLEATRGDARSRRGRRQRKRCRHSNSDGDRDGAEKTADANAVHAHIVNRELPHFNHAPRSNCATPRGWS